MEINHTPTDFYLKNLPELPVVCVLLTSRGITMFLMSQGFKTRVQEIHICLVKYDLFLLHSVLFGNFSAILAYIHHTVCLLSVIALSLSPAFKRHRTGLEILNCVCCLLYSQPPTVCRSCVLIRCHIRPCLTSAWGAVGGVLLFQSNSKFTWRQGPKYCIVSTF